MEITIRPVRIEDAEAINAIRRSPSVVENTFGMPSERIEANRKFIENLSGDDHLLVAEVDGEVVGMAGIHLKRGKARHSAGLGIMVRDDYQGRGIGRRLMESLLDLADNWLDLRRVELEVLADNDRAIQLYKSLGFEEEGVKRAAHIAHGEYKDLLMMARLRGV